MNQSNNFAKFIVTSVVLFAFVAIGYVIGQRGDEGGLESTAFATPVSWPLDNASGGKSLSLATGHISVQDGVEGLYGLDHLTGDLFCWVLNPGTGAVASTFRTNVNSALGVDGDADYVMVTGMMDFRIANTGGDTVSDSVVYVGDGNSGKAVGFVLRYDRQAINRGNSGAGRLEAIANMVTRAPGTVRNQGQNPGR